MKNIFILLLLLLAASCSKYETKYEGPTPLDEELTDVNFEQPIVYADQYSIKMTNTFFTRNVTLLDSANWIEGVALNDKLDQIAYKTPNNNVRIMDTAGNLIKEISNTTNVVSFEFYENGVLYMCYKNGQVKFEGGTIPIKSTNLKSYIPDLSELLSFIILEDGIVFCIYKSTSNNVTKMDFSNPQFSSSSNEVFPLQAQEVLFMRAYNYSATKNYKLQIMAYNDFSGLVMYEASRSSTFGGFYKQTETIKLTKGQFQDKILKYKAGEYFGFEQLNSLYRAWENFPRSSTIRFIDF